MLKKTLTLTLLLSSLVLGQSLQDMVEQAVGGASPGLAAKPVQAEPAGPVIIPSELPKEEIIELVNREDETPEPEYYGYAYFANKSKLVMLDNLPAPVNYLVGPGDEIIITIWGDTQLREKATISRDGSIYFENVGLVSLVNLSFEQAQKVLRARFEKVFATLRGGARATTFMEVTLGNLKSVNIHFLGEVVSPGLMPVHPFSTVTTGLIQAGGVSTIGSLREVQVLRGGRVLETIDYYEYLQEGSIEKNIRLLDNDVISVPVRKSTIQVRGKVRRPGIFELKQGETLAHLIKYAGGLMNDAGAKVEIRRVLPPEFRKAAAENIQHIWVELKEAGTIQLMDGDEVRIVPLYVSDQFVKIEGQVKNAGEFTLAPGMDVRDLLELSGGVFTSDHWSKVYPYRADLIRSDRNTGRSEILPIRLDKLKDGDDGQNLVLEPNDKLIIYPTEINKYNKTVEIFGDVRNPGEYSLDENMGLTDLILRAGGFSYSAYPAEVIINSVDPFVSKGKKLSTERKLKVDPESFNQFQAPDDQKLQNKDQVFVRRHPDYELQRNITLDGEVRLPGVYALEVQDENLASLIQRAGGLKDEAFMQGLRIQRGDKRLILERKGKDKVDLNLPLRPGDFVYIPKHTNTVEVMGQVNSPGLVQFKKGLSVKDYIKIAGNFTEDGDRRSVAVYYANGESKTRFLWMYPEVREGSKIVVYKKPEELPLDKTVFLTEFTTIVIQSLSLLLVASKVIN